MKILVLEDEKAVQRAYQRVLRTHELRVVDSPQDAMDLIEAGYEPDVIVSDWDMPTGTGGEFCIALRQRGNNIPVIIVSGSDKSDVIDRIGANAFLPKPEALSLLATTIERFTR